MNKDSYAGLTPDAEGRFDKLTGKALACAPPRSSMTGPSRRSSWRRRASGWRSSSLRPDVRKAMFDAAEPVVDKIIADIEKDGVADARAVYQSKNETAGERATTGVPCGAAGPLLDAIDRVVHAVALYCGGAVLAALMTTIIIDVIGRYSSTLRSTARSTSRSCCWCSSVSCAIGYGGRAGAHVTADMVTTLVGPKFEWISGVCIKLFAAGITAIWSWRLFVTGQTAARLGESTQLLDIPFSPVYTGALRSASGFTRGAGRRGAGARSDAARCRC